MAIVGKPVKNVRTLSLKVSRVTQTRTAKPGLCGNVRSSGTAPSETATTRWTPVRTTTRVLKKPVRVTWRGSTWDSAQPWRCTQRPAVRLESVSHGENQISVLSTVIIIMHLGNAAGVMSLVVQ